MKKLKFLLISVLAASLISIFWGTDTSVVAQLPDSQGTPQIAMSAGVESQLTVTPYYSEDPAALVASVVIEGTENVILVDSQLKLSDASNVADIIEATGKNLQAIFITHAHPDHYLGLESVLAKFPDTPIYAGAATVEGIKSNTSRFIDIYKGQYPGDVTTNPEIPVEVYTEDSMELDGETLEIMSMRGDVPEISVISIPAAKTVIAADVYFMGTHAFMAAASSPEVRQEWMASFEKIKSLNPDLVISGHKAPNASLNDSVANMDDAAKYIATYGEAICTQNNAEEAKGFITQAYPDYPLAWYLGFGLTEDVAYGDC
ncbi:Zn-dependent hydrolase, glyoxylase [Xenococcus sp. PCC 7305]|uniref:MBL fold metallo-hydrolase n=1 Tax=Xenococcus sp. PCC 7305 TaxID=102125 RepID=UPI0002AC450C|nr:MBL fold metallo-hydrolase [Xenococcus sp. PCC 7305]ELS03515.1 Zn-dependent hydrolase, glyoxylase [Xenococcus sp. PCC 7305]